MPGQRFFALVFGIALAAGSCASPSVPDEQTDSAAANDPAVTTAEAEPLPTGRAALAAAQGEPHVLWFWGAH